MSFILSGTYFLFLPQNDTAKAGFIVNAITIDESRVVQITKGMENINFQIIPVINIIDPKIHTTTKVVEISTFL
ncbi:MAG: hypothetical protein LBC61_03450 [Candidatus Peribacteria bacterium]|nr:hypothetical protein [Candidatus Peribacteria bacterium]